jgi:hypothetical protein
VVIGTRAREALPIHHNDHKNSGRAIKRGQTYGSGACNGVMLDNNGSALKICARSIRKKLLD